MSRSFTLLFSLPLILFARDNAEISVISEKPIQTVTMTQSHNKSSSMFTNEKAFTGRVNGNHVRMRVGHDLESEIVAELDKDELVVVSGSKGDFYAVQKAYIFRSFVLDGVVEGNRVNVRLKPDKEAPIIGHFSSGTKVEGTICKDNHKWLEIDPPSETRFFIAKEYIDHAGGPDLKAIKDKRHATVNDLLESANLLTQTEMRKPYHEIDIANLSRNYQTIVNDYIDFPKHCAKAKQALSNLQEDYLQKKIAYLEAKAENITSDETVATASQNDLHKALHQVSDRMKTWETVEEALYLSWSGMHHAKTMDDFYVAQKETGIKLSGIIEAYSDAVKCKPGDYILRQDGVPAAYLYSATVNLEALVGKKVSIVASARPNNSFAFPAYYVLDAK